MTNQPEFNGLMLIDKPKDISSFGVISKLRYLTAIKKIGYCGTLDPFATGLLPVLFGRYTKLSQYLENSDKVYFFTFVLGKETDTLDLTGNIVSEMKKEILDKKVLSGQLDQKLQDLVATHFTGKIEQIPPMYSAIKVEGKPLYKYAREGESVERKKRSVEIYKADLSDIYPKDGDWQCDATVTCSKGTYIRTWIDDLAKKAGCFAYAKELRRLGVGNLSLNSNSVGLEELSQLFENIDHQPSKMRDILRENYFYPIGIALKDIPIYQLNDEEVKRVIHGQKLTLKNFQVETSTNDVQLIYKRKLLAIVNYNPAQSNFVKYKRVLADQL